MDTEVQDKFFTEINLELQKVDSFFRGKYVSLFDKNWTAQYLAQEAEAQFKFRELKLKATAYQEGLLQRHRFKSILHLPSGNVEVLKLAFGEFYLNLILLQNFQVNILNTSLLSHFMNLTEIKLYSFPENFKETW